MSACEPFVIPLCSSGKNLQSSARSLRLRSEVDSLDWLRERINSAWRLAAASKTAGCLLLNEVVGIVKLVMRILQRPAGLALILALLLGSGSTLGASVVSADCQEIQYAEIMVKFEPDADSQRMAEVHLRSGGRVVGCMPEIGVQVVEVPAATVERALASYISDPLVAYAEPNPVLHLLDFPDDPPDDPRFDLQWGMERAKALEAWAVTRGSQDIRIAILDSGIDLDHPDLSSKIVASKNFSTSHTADDRHGHGTHVAGIAAALTNNGVGVAGMGCDSSLMNVKVLGDDGHGSAASIADGIIWATNGPDNDPETDDGAHVINMSLGTLMPSYAIEDAVNYAWERGVVLVAAAGNHGSSRPSYPARYPEVIAVAGTSKLPENPLTASSSHGEWVDVAAPGESIWSTYKNGGYITETGTSMASPHAAGLAALLFTRLQDADGNGFLNDEVRYALESTCTDVGIDVQYGLINARDAVTASIPSLGAIAGSVTHAATGSPLYSVYGCSVKAGTREAFARPDGSYAIQGVPAGTYDVTVSAAGYPTYLQTVTVGAGEVTVADFSIDSSPTGSIQGMVKDVDCSPVQGALVTDGTRQVATAVDGSYIIPCVPQGYYTVTVVAPRYLPASSQVTVRSGETASQDFVLWPVVLNVPPEPSDPWPQNDAAAVPISTGLSWAGGDADTSDPVTYDVYFGTSTDPPLVSKAQPGTDYDLDTLDYETRYWWRIVVFNERGVGREGPLWVFTTEPNPPPRADFVAAPLTGNEPLIVTFTDAAESLDGIISWLWDFGDGAISCERSPSHTYDQDGAYSVSLTVTEADGQSDTMNKADCIVVSDSQPDCRFDITLLDRGVQLIASFTDCSTSYDGVVSWQWDFGDGNTSEVQDPDHIYTQGGLHTVTLAVWDADGSIGQISHQVEVVIPTLDMTQTAAQEPAEGSDIGEIQDCGAEPTGASGEMNDASDEACLAMSQGTLGLDGGCPINPGWSDAEGAGDSRTSGVCSGQKAGTDRQVGLFVRLLGRLLNSDYMTESSLLHRRAL
jgi:thermitase